MSCKIFRGVMNRLLHRVLFELWVILKAQIYTLRLFPDAIVDLGTNKVWIKFLDLLLLDASE